MKTNLLAAFIASFLAVQSFAASLNQGTRELVVQGLFDVETTEDSQLDLTIKYGHFVLNYIELGAAFDFSDNDIVSSYGIGAFAEYNFDQGTEVVPFVGASIGWGRSTIDTDVVDEENDAVVLGAEAGSKYFLAENIALAASGEFNWASADLYGEENDVSDTNIQLNLGMRFYF